jgi:hypothetical protein
MEPLKAIREGNISISSVTPIDGNSTDPAALQNLRHIDNLTNGQITNEVFDAVDLQTLPPSDQSRAIANKYKVTIRNVNGTAAGLGVVLIGIEAPRDEKTEAKGMPNGIAQSMAATQYAAHEAQRRSPETTEQGTAAVPMAPTAVVQVNQATHTDVVQGTAGNEHAAQQAQRRSPEATRQGTAEESVQGTAGNEQAEPEAPSQAQPGARAVTDLPKQFALQTPQGSHSLHLPDGLLSGELANLLAGELWDEGGTTVLPTLSKVQVAEVAKVIVAPPQMSEENARRALAHGGVVEALAGLLFFNPAFRQLLRGSGK